MNSAKIPPAAIPTGPVSAIPVLTNPMTRPMVSSAVLRWIRVIIGPLNHADTRPIPAHKIAKIQNMFGEIKPDTEHNNPKEIQAIAIKRVSFLPPPHTIRILEPISNPAAKVASAMEAI